ncbi:MAG: hypothetical protein HKN26_00165 [Acidimicrobiales bacterium]|nr:hypothetical protein [Acidimicrobiales bacterium]
MGDPEPIPNATRASLAGFDLDAIAPDAGLIETLPDPLLDGPATEPLVDAPPLPSRMTIDELDALLAEPDAALPEADDLAAEAATADEPTADALEDMEAATVDGPGDMDAAADEADDPVDRDEPVAEEPSVPRRPAGLAVRAEPPESVEAESGDAEPAEPQKPEDANQIVAETLDAESIDAEPVEAVVALPVVEPTRTEESTPAFEDEPIVAAADVDAPAPAIPAEASPPLEELAALPPLPKRRRGATMGLPAPAVPEADAASVFPASAAASEHDEPAAPARGDLQQIAERQSSGRRSPEDLKRMLSSYRRGVERSRYDRPE